MKWLLKGKYCINNNLITILITTILAFIMLVTTSFAWFSMSDKVQLKFTSASGEVVLYVAMYEGESGNGQYVWDEGTVLQEQSEQSFGSQFVSPNYPTQLGTVDNLAFRKEQNNLWFCLKIKKTTGVNFSSLRLSYDDAVPYRLFSDLNSENGPTEIVDTTVTNKIDSALNTLINIDSLIISSVPKEDFFVEEQDRIPDINEDCADSFSVVKYSDLDAESFSGTIKELDLENKDYYYVYFRTYCALDSYVSITEEISAYFPCVMEFDLRLTLVIDGKVEQGN